MQQKKPAKHAKVFENEIQPHEMIKPLYTV